MLFDKKTRLKLRFFKLLAVKNASFWCILNYNKADNEAPIFWRRFVFLRMYQSVSLHQMRQQILFEPGLSAQQHLLKSGTVPFKGIKINRMIDSVYPRFV